jgi:glycosyltransferase involved in cell wall biosynthesis
MLMVSQEFLPSLGGKQVSVNRIGMMTKARGIADVEILTCMTDVAACKTFDERYPLPVIRVVIPFANFRAWFRKSRREGVIRFYGGDVGPTLRQKIGMAVSATITTFSMLRALRRRLQTSAEAPVILNAQDYTAILVSLLAKRFDRKPGRIKVVFVNGSINRKSGFWLADGCIRRMLRACDEILCVSQASADELVREFDADPAHTKGYRLWFDMNDVRDARTSRESYDGPLRIVFVGRVVPDKGIREILALAKRIDERRLENEFALTVIGDSDHPICEELRVAAAASKCLTWAGRVGKPALWQKLADQDVLYMPSLWAEGSGNVAVEAAACGLAVVASAVGGIPENVRLLPHHRLLDGHDPEMLLKVFAEVRAELRATGRANVAEAQRRATKEQFSERNFDIHEQTYRALFAGAAASLSA